MKILLITYFLVSFNAQAADIKLKDGLYFAGKKFCPEKTMIFIKKKDESFYLLGKNQRFLVSPNMKKSEETLNGCHYTYTSENDGRVLLEKEVAAVCETNKKMKVTINKLEIVSDQSFKLYLNDGKTCFYRWKMD